MRTGKPYQAKGKWWIRVTDEFGKRRKKSFAAYTDAVRAMVAEKARVGEVRDGRRSPTPPDRTFNQLADYWVANRVPRMRSPKDHTSIIRCHLRPFFGSMKLADIGLADTDRFQVERLHLDKKTIANHLTLLITMLGLAVDLGWLTKAPKVKKPKVRLFDKDFSYLRTDDEIRRFLLAAEAEGEFPYLLYATALYTGMREGELAALEWADADLEKRLITVQRSFDGPTKAEDVRYVPVLDPLLPLLRQWRLRCPGKLLFPNQRGGMQCPSARIFQEVLHRVLDAAGFPKGAKGGRVRRHITFHGLRHTFASQWMTNGGDIFRLQRVLGHKDVQMTQRYAHLAPAAFSADHGRLGAEVPTAGTLVALPTSSNV